MGRISGIINIIGTNLLTAAACAGLLAPASAQTSVPPYGMQSGTFQRLRGAVHGTIAAVNGHLVTVAGNGHHVVIDDTPALEHKMTGNVSVGREIVAVGYWRGGTFYATAIEDAHANDAGAALPDFGAFTRKPDTLTGTITGVSGNRVTLQQTAGTVVVNDQPALNHQATGTVAVGRRVSAQGYWLHGVFYVTAFADTP